MTLMTRIGIGKSETFETQRKRRKPRKKLPKSPEIAKESKLKTKTIL
jgi:hypothetical protein